MVKRKRKPKNQRQARYTWRPVVELHWVVARLNEDGSESFHSRYGSPGLDDKDDWIRDDAVRVAQYYRIVIREDEVVYMEDEQGNFGILPRTLFATSHIAVRTGNPR